MLKNGQILFLSIILDLNLIKLKEDVGIMVKFVDTNARLRQKYTGSMRVFVVHTDRSGYEKQMIKGDEKGTTGIATILLIL